MSSQNRSGLSLLPTSTPLQSPYRLAMPAALTTTSITATTCTSPSTVASPVSSMPFGSPISAPFAAASTFYLTADPGIPGPGNFFGDETQDPRDWIKTFQSWANIKNFPERTKIEIFKILMKRNASRWIDSLHSSKTDTFDHIKAAFFKRFIDNDEWTDFIKMGQLRQEPQESVITYLERAWVLAKRVKLQEKHRTSSFDSKTETPDTNIRHSTKSFIV